MGRAPGAGGRLAGDGFIIGRKLDQRIREKETDLARFAATKAIYFHGDDPLAEGDRLVQSDLASVLRRIAADGPAGFYGGDVGRSMVETVRKAGGIWTSDDLQSYRAIFRDPVRFAVPGQPRTEIVTMGPPASGWLIFGETMALMKAQHALRLRPDDPRRAVAFIEASRLAFADRNTLLGDPDHTAVPVAELLSASYLRERQKDLPAHPPGHSDNAGAGLPQATSHNTTHIVVMDSHGGVVSLTTTLNALFGSKWTAPGTGVMLNNEMDDFDTRPGKPNLYGLVGSGVNAVAPGARMLSSMSPTIVLRGGRVWFALGGRGGPKIATGVLQVILHRCFDGMDLAQAVAAPRLHHQWWPDEVRIEAGDSFPQLRVALEAIGYTMVTEDDPGKVMAAERLPDGRFVGVVDPRTSGLAQAVSTADGKR